MTTDGTSYEATANSAHLLVRAISSALDGQDPTVDLVARALIGELGAMSEPDSPENALILPAVISDEQLFSYACVENVIEQTGYTDNIVTQIMKEVGSLVVEISPKSASPRNLITDRRAQFQVFDIVAMREMENDGASNSKPQWLVRAGQWANWLLTAQSRELYSRISRAALSAPDIETFKMAVKLGEYVCFQLRAETDLNETKIPLLTVLAEVCDATLLSARQKKDEHRIAQELDRFEQASQALAREGVCSINISRIRSAESTLMPADNDNEALLHSSIVTISGVA